MPLFLSTYQNKVDAKGRVSVPAGFRSALAESSFQGVVVFKSKSHSALEGFALDDMADIAGRLDHFDMFSDNQDDLAAMIFAESRQLSFDKDGRIVLPEDLREFCGIENYASFVGMGRKFQIWEPSLLGKRLAEARGNVLKQGLTLPSNKD